MKILNFIRWSILGTILIYFIFCMVLSLTNERFPKETQCGKVLKKSYDEVTIKYGSRTDLYLLIDFYNIPTKAINVTETAYLQAEIGKEICLQLSKQQTFFREISFLLGIILNWLSVLGVIVFIILFLIYGNKIFKSKFYNL